MEFIPNWNEHLRLYVGASCFIRGCSVPLCFHCRSYTMDLQLPQIIRAFWWRDLGWRSEKPEKLYIPNTLSPTQPGCVQAWRISAAGGGDKAVLFHSSAGVELSVSVGFLQPCYEGAGALLIPAWDHHLWVSLVGNTLGPANPTAGQSCQCSYNSKPDSPERDMAQTHGSALCLLCCFRRGRWQEPSSRVVPIQNFLLPPFSSFSLPCRPPPSQIS